MEQAEYKETLSNMLNQLGAVELKHSMFGGEKIFLNGVKIGGMIFEKASNRFLLQLKPTKAGEQILLEYPQKYSQPAPYSGTPSFTFVKLEPEAFFLELFEATYRELSSM